MQETFEAYVVARGAALLRFAYVLSGDRYLAEDIVQEVLSRVHRRWHRMASVDQPDAYLRTAIVREFLTWRRRRSGREAPLDALPELASRAPDTAARHAARDEMWRLLAELPRNQRTVLVLRFYEDLPDAEIALVVGCKEATVRVHAFRGLARLRAAMRPTAQPGANPPARLTQPIGGE